MTVDSLLRAARACLAVAGAAAGLYLVVLGMQAAKVSPSDGTPWFLIVLAGAGLALASLLWGYAHLAGYSDSETDDE